MNFTNDRYKIVTDNKTFVIALTTYAGRTVKGVARLTPGDVFDLEKGKKLAMAKANLKVAEKRATRALKKTTAVRNELDMLEERYTDYCDYLNNAVEARKNAEKELVELNKTM